ncbi:tRNA preQ1(34) S-adenosylmethionine ribosyltransferase-isomerase QueA [Cupriavidus sp.]|uniref:tRNA preQ1(34) S-adenosylmethionine ribosyltransferase-isomerase QueA n=1 Tax=Cupriavidus sp. TaxID=1873897 RepID=UPI0025C208EF|nr:tRNA preQ1(34) S-adenosylmethionine ribosyltransferase-isomerase QueA [Cupriavidus sp.]MCA3185379.1 tRNA preQ1(34) S-adenosylmethionine ribosyltransferase-isomerase QueA [Cupriavidus sp.]MCA3189854.1 tRNA preQ1(34) S-adenosylmethionine ribosyltransferase-isomerase QueA [Cupriavidus sp.]MCA3196753.1 tRNA preQ1(34) S-adenosylmethionine ribosyltransferase-isomerase QueA [Cupriavidus sp.]MCA3204252.1 tRNA preQ1(34) S-adenosylmethionine ribosyltransferase-isomerase QueA [Cupriavidus sp.]MCA32082
MLTLSDFDFPLPPELIAQSALPDRSASRLLVVERTAPDDTADAVRLVDRAFSDILEYLSPDDLLVFNDTRVIKARFFGQKPSGGRIEVLVERVVDSHTVLAQVRASKTPAEGSPLHLADGAFTVTVGPRVDQFFTLRFPQPALDLIERFGRLPLPPYITHDPDAYDETRYQTVYARNPGAVAAPTAGLHFDDALFARLDAAGIRRAFLTLHVGAGTFQPVRTEDLSEHKMHSEWYAVTPELADAVRETRARGGRVIAVGTTSLRALESAAAEDGTLRPGTGDTDIFITPGYRFRAVDALITNFHLPKSTLLMLVSALAGVEAIRAAYRHAVAERYRFFSYGDAMLLTRRD